MKNLETQRGFTLIETLVAITILMIAIAGPLTVANKAFTSSIDAKNQTIAFNLAQEGLEYLNNLKDNKMQWPRIQANCLAECGINFNGDTNVINGFNPIGFGLCSDMNSCKLSASPSLGYTHQATIGNKFVASPFTRKFYLTRIESGANNIAGYLATIVVSWNTGAVYNEVRLQEILTESER